METASPLVSKRERISSPDPTALATSIADRLPADSVDLLNQHRSSYAAAVLLAFAEAKAVRILNSPQLQNATAILSALPASRAARLVDQMSADRAAAVVREMRVSVRNEVLAAVALETKAALDRLLTYPEDCAGGIMTTEFVAVPSAWSVQQVLAHIRDVEHARETVYAIFILDHRDKTLIGTAPLRRLVSANPAANVLAAAVTERLVSITPDTPLDETVRVISKYNLLAVPVLDQDRHLVGIVTVDDAIDTLVSQQDSQVQHLGGMEPLEVPYMRVGFPELIRKRAGWLCVLFLAEMLTASAMQSFEEELEKAIVLSLFIPLIMSSGGNSGSQATSLMIRALSLREVALGDWWRVLLRELPAGVTLGAILGALGAARVTIWQVLGLFDYGPHWRLVALTICAALVGIVTFGSLTGSILPFIARCLGFDPATASAPFVATLVDVTGIVIYFSVAILILKGTML
jgi:magnesium transporter